jgi:type II secretion system (T2SS) protein E
MAAKKRLGEMLLDAGVIDETQLLSALGHQRKWGGKLGQALIDLKLATEPQIVSALGRKFGYEVAQVAALQPSPVLEGALRLVPRDLALRQTIIPIAADSTTITVAMGDPSNIGAVDELSFRTGRRVKVVIAGDREIAAAVRRLYYGEDGTRREAIPLDPSTEAPFETTRDPFAAMPDHIREGYFGRPAHTLAPEGARAAATRPPAPTPPPPPGRPSAPPLTREEPTFTPPPTLARAPAPAAAPPTTAPPPVASETSPPAAAPEEDTSDLALGEPILATDLLVDADEGPFEAAPAEATPAPPPQASPLVAALERLARGEELPSLGAARLAGALARLLLRRGVVTEDELADELRRK